MQGTTHIAGVETREVLHAKSSACPLCSFDHQTYLFLSIGVQTAV